MGGLGGGGGGRAGDLFSETRLGADARGAFGLLHPPPLPRASPLHPPPRACPPAQGQLDTLCLEAKNCALGVCVGRRCRA